MSQRKRRKHRTFLSASMSSGDRAATARDDALFILCVM